MTIYNLPKISVVTPSFNQAQFIGETIQSVVCQNYTNFEHIVIDGGSTDGTVEILKRYPHLTWVSEKDRGQTDALNKGLKMATGDIIAWINSDDYYQEDAFNKVASFFQQNPNAQFVFGDCLFTYGGRREDLYVKNKPLAFEDIIRYWDRWIPPTQPTIFFKSSLLDEFGYFDETLHLAMDYDFWVRVSRKYQLHYIPACLAVYRFHEASKSALGTDWQHFYPEWHKVYTRYKSHSRLLGNRSKLLTIAVPLLHDELKRSKDHIDVIQNMISMFVTKIAKETEIIIISDIENVAELFNVGDLLVDVSFELVKELNATTFLKTVYCKSRGFAFHCPPLIKNLPVHWYIEALDLLLDTQELEFVENKNLQCSHPLLCNHDQIDPRKLVRNTPISANDTFSNNSNAEHKMQISIVIPTFNRRELLEEAIDSIAMQTYGGRFELIIVDDGSSDGTEQMVRQKAQSVSFPLVYLSQTNAGPATARNNGIHHARADLIAFTDSDCTVDKRWLEVLVRHFSNPEIAGAGGIAVSKREDTLSKYFDYTGLYNSRLFPDKPGVNYLLTLNACYRKQALIDVGMFSQDFTHPGGEDPELCIRLRNKGYRLVFEPNAIVVHNHKADLAEFYTTFYRYGAGKALIFKKHGIWGENRKLEDLVAKERLVDFNSNCISNGVDQDLATTFTSLHYLQEIALFCGYQDRIRELESNERSVQKTDVSSDKNLRALVLSSSIECMKKYENIHAGQRCVIIGNGPSLNKMDLSFLEHEICFGMNRIFLMFDQWKFRPTYYVAVNQLVIEQSADEILALPMPKFLSQRGIPYFDNPPHDLMFIDERKEWVFSKDPYRGMHEGWTVTYVAMQLAYFMGFSEVVLIGVDHNFVASGDPNKEVVSQGDDPNHFHPDYFGKGMRWHLPDLERSEHSYQLAKEAFESSGRRIVDATLGGKLTIFPKVDYKNHFGAQAPLMPPPAELSQSEVVALMEKFIRQPDETTGVKLVNALRSKNLHHDADQVQQAVMSLKSGGR
jgi:glycosyltransferase involved in cell wall biosynthesis